MENKDKIRQLSEYINITKELEEVRAYYMAKTYSISAQHISDMPRGGGCAHDTVGSAIAKRESIDEMVDKRIRKLETKRIEIEEIINSLDRSLHRRLMHMRYIQGMSWECICVTMAYSWRQVHRLHRNILEKIKV
jgi:RinA family phage transcriptional activator